MIKILSYAVTGQRIETTETAMLVAGTVNIYTARFAFGAEWDGLQRTAVFAVDGITREQMLEDDACTVPWEVLVAGNRLRVGVYGTKADGTRLPTIWTERRLYINPGAGPTQEAADPSPTLVEQLLGRIGDPANLKTEDKSSLVAAINEVQETGGGGGTSDHSKLTNRDAANQHPMSAITGLEAALEGKQPTGDYLTDKDLDATLTAKGKAADAAAVGARFDSLSEEMLTQEADPTVPAWAKEPTKPSYTASEVGADPSGTAASQVSAHNTGTDTHSDIRLLIQGLTDRLNALADSDDTTLDQLSEIVAYIKSNRDLISAITTDKVNVSDIVDDLVTNVANKPLSAAQGVALKALIDAISLPPPTAEDAGKVPVVNADGTGYGLEILASGGETATPELLYSGTAENVSAFQQNIDMKGHRRFCVIVGGTRGESAISIKEGSFYLGGKGYKIFYYTSWLDVRNTSYHEGCVTEHFTPVDEDKIVITYQKHTTGLNGILNSFQGNGSVHSAPKLGIIQGYNATNEDGIELSFSAAVESVTVYVFGY